MPTFTARDGRTLHTSLLGEGEEPIVVVPGGPCRGAEYLEDLAGLAAVRPIVTLHPRGTPTTGGLSRGWWTDGDDLIDLIDALGLASADVLAHSAGTRLALAAAAREPQCVRSLALVTPPASWLGGVESDSAEVAGRRQDAMVDAAYASLVGPGPSDQPAFDAARVVEGPAGYGAWGPREEAHVGVGDWALASTAAWFLDIPADAAARIRAATLPPTLVIGGSEDILVGVRPLPAYADALGAELVMLDGCGHYPWVEQPEAFRGALDPWFARG